MTISVLLWMLLSSAFALLVLYPATVVIVARNNRKRAVGFFHPYTNDGGGGERVLWCAVKAIQELNPNLECIIYTGDDASPQSLVERAVNRFGVRFPHLPKVVRLYKRKWIEESTYPRFTMMGQNIGSIFLAWEALSKFTPSYYFDTSGHAFTYPLARIFGCKVISYTHYPTISSDMVSRVRDRFSMYNNDVQIAGSIWLSRCKLLYYLFLTWLYGLVGSCAHLAMVNSSWTKAHIEELWKIPCRTRRVYPPCDTKALQVLPLERSFETRAIISVAQFRPEKAHALQLEAFALAIERLNSSSYRPKLQFVGSCRNNEDQDRLLKLKSRSIELNLDKHVEFHKDLPYKDLIQLLGGAVAGIHSMIDEHFGICVVEYMAAGAIPIAHNSAGPKMDIVLEEDGQQTGFLASTVEDYADAIVEVLTMPEEERLKMATAARKRAERFSEQRFYEDFRAAIEPVLSTAGPVR
ncbi:hypothetical protein H6P81_012896 [Aristolochia fimbriata]|uniref:GDP-Man:Man(3)GlcNAc(2)-PP-Dol alpha-1,2-mannosyltransferase n=1 Tax=Aristolochia fimbriata TaxID=158543 RepID=A0AAV7ED62_ARIFI|nr:hypothetical protein H6P81_012896 [Aristolochia fimbriata]